MKELSGDALLALPVRLHGVHLGRPVDLLLDRDRERLVGIDVLCGDETHRFLPLPTAAVGDDAIAIHSPLVLLEEDELDFYRARTFRLSALRGRPVQRDGREVGKLHDVVFRSDGQLVAAILDGGRRLAFDGTLGFAPERRSAA
jgi:PRC-barrel domain